MSKSVDLKKDFYSITCQIFHSWHKKIMFLGLFKFQKWDQNRQFYRSRKLNSRQMLRVLSHRMGVLMDVTLLRIMPNNCQQILMLSIAIWSKKHSRSRIEVITKIWGNFFITRNLFMFQIVRVWSFLPADIVDWDELLLKRKIAYLIHKLWSMMLKFFEDQNRSWFLDFSNESKY